LTTPQRTGRRAAAITGEILLALLGFALAIAGFGLAGMSEGDGVLNLESGEYSVDGYAAVGDSWDESMYGLYGLADAVRIDIAPSGDAPVFAGFTTAEAAQEYLAGVEHTLIHRATGPEGPTEEEVSGDAPAALPAEQDIWTAQVEGEGDQTLELPSEGLQGELVPVVMNADGSADVAGAVTVLYEIPALPWVIGGLIGAGFLGMAAAVWLFIRTRRAASAA
jgi:hypothetical protein